MTTGGMRNARASHSLEMARNGIAKSNQRMEDIRSTAADTTVVSGKFPVNNIGEGYKDIIFPTIFSTIPGILFGYEIQGNNDDPSRPNAHIKKSRAPSINAALYDWNVVDRPPVSRFYRGAKILIVSEGPANTRFIVHWQATGIGFMEPMS